MLGSKKPGFGISGGTTLISQNTVVIGDVHFSGSLDVEGTVQGNIVAQEGNDAQVRILGKGRVEGEIRAPNVIVNGAVEGDVHSSKQLELASKAQVNGNVFYTLVEMAAGSAVNGSLTHVVEGSAPAEEKSTASIAEHSGSKRGRVAKVD
jgi:cytoskeletal protein CcmA (bactofilin family)